MITGKKFKEIVSTFPNDARIHGINGKQIILVVEYEDGKTGFYFGPIDVDIDENEDLHGSWFLCRTNLTVDENEEFDQT